MRDLLLFLEPRAFDQSGAMHGHEMLGRPQDFDRCPTAHTLLVRSHLGLARALAEFVHERELADALLSGIVVLGVGNGCLILAERLIPSGIASLFVSVTPFWMVGIEALFPGGASIERRTLLGLLIGFSGCALLVGPELARSGFASSYWKGFLILQVGSAAWAFGSIYNRNRPRLAHPIVTGTFQQLGAGLAYLPLALLLTSGPFAWTARSLGGFLYQVAFGSIVGFSATIFCYLGVNLLLSGLHSYGG